MSKQTPAQRRQAAINKLLADPTLKESDRQYFRSAIMIQEYLEYMVEEADKALAKKAKRN